MIGEKSDLRELTTHARKGTQLVADVQVPRLVEPLLRVQRDSCAIPLNAIIVCHKETLRCGPRIDRWIA